MEQADLRTSYQEGSTPTLPKIGCRLFLVGPIIFGRTENNWVRLREPKKERQRIVQQGSAMVVPYWVVCPKGSKYPIFEVSGSKDNTLNGIWDQTLNSGYLDPFGMTNPKQETVTGDLEPSSQLHPWIARELHQA